MVFMYLTIDSFSRFPSYKRATGTGNALAEMGHTVYIVLEDCSENRDRMKKEAPLCRPVWIPKCGLFREIYLKIKNVRKIRPDYLYSLSYTPRCLSCFRFLLPRRTCFILEYCELYSSFKRFWFFRELLSLFEVDRLVCASGYLKNVFEKRIKLLHRDCKILYQPYAYPEYLNGSRKLAHPTKHIVFMAALWRGYGVYDVLEACMMAFRTNDCILDIIGKGPEYENVKIWVEEHHMGERVNIHGFVDENQLDAIFSNADVFIAPMRDSIQDRARCPSKIFYYIPYGKPIVTCKIGEPYSILGNAGYYYEPDNVVAMSNAIAKALKDSKSFSYTKGFVEKHSWRARALELLEWVE